MRQDFFSLKFGFRDVSLAQRLGGEQKDHCVNMKRAVELEIKCLTEDEGDA